MMPGADTVARGGQDAMRRRLASPTFEKRVGPRGRPLLRPQKLTEVRPSDSVAFVVWCRQRGAA